MHKYITQLQLHISDYYIYIDIYNFYRGIVAVVVAVIVVVEMVVCLFAVILHPSNS